MTEEEFVQRVELPDGTQDDVVVFYGVNADGARTTPPSFRLRTSKRKVVSEPDGGYHLHDTGDELKRV